MLEKSRKYANQISKNCKVTIFPASALDLIHFQLQFIAIHPSFLETLFLTATVVFGFSASGHSRSRVKGQKEGKCAGGPEINIPNTTGAWERQAQTSKSRKGLQKDGERASTTKKEGLASKRKEKSGGVSYSGIAQKEAREFEG